MQSKERECPICLEEMAVNVAVTKCQHMFHTECLMRCASKSNTCPLCRTQLFEKLPAETIVVLQLRRARILSEVGAVVLD